MLRQPTLERITPTKATEYLNDNKANRHLRNSLVTKYAGDMKNQRWTDCPEPISFYDDGDIADGQHRLWAIVESGCTIPFLVLRGLSRAAGLNINTGAGRTLVDNARICGRDDHLSHALIATARMYALGAKQRGAQSNGQRLEYVERHREPCDWAVSNGPSGKGLRNAVVLAAVARAYASGEDEDRLKRFGEVVGKGFAEGDADSAAIALRNYMMSNRLVFSPAEYRELFLKVQNAIHYFMRRKRLVIIKTVSDEAYPLSKCRKRGS